MWWNWQKFSPDKNFWLYGYPLSDSEGFLEACFYFIYRHFKLRSSTAPVCSSTPIPRTTLLPGFQCIPMAPAFPLEGCRGGHSCAKKVIPWLQESLLLVHGNHISIAFVFVWPRIEYNGYRVIRWCYMLYDFRYMYSIEVLFFVEWIVCV